MKKRELKIRILVLLMSLTMLALLFVQGYWFTRAHDTREAQFAQRANLALRMVTDQLRRLQGDATAQIPAIRRDAANAFYVPADVHFRIETLDSLLATTFARHDIDTDYEYALYAQPTQELVLGNRVQPGLSKLSDIPVLTEPPTMACQDRAQDSVAYDFAVTFPNMGGHVLESMGIWIFSSVAMVAVLLIFALLLIVLLREKRLARLKKNFINNLTHELKTPITNISIASEVLLGPRPGGQDEKQQVYADIIHKETQRLKALVDRVLQISVLESGKIALDKEKVDLNALIREVVHVVMPRIQARDGQISCELSAAQATILADRHHLLNTLYNLIDNADKYSPDSPQIRISTSNDKDGIRIAVHDRGMGVSTEKQKLIFDKFYRVEDGDVQNERGFGLGLSYVQLILQAHRGRIGLRSQPGHGSCFTIFLPFDTGL